jgi:hypothetical protein
MPMGNDSQPISRSKSANCFVDQRRDLRFINVAIENGVHCVNAMVDRRVISTDNTGVVSFSVTVNRAVESAK